MRHYQGTQPDRAFELTVNHATGVANLTLGKVLGERLRDLFDHHQIPDETAQGYVARLRREGYRILEDDVLAICDALRSGVFAPTALVVTGLPYDFVPSAPAPGEDPRDFKPTQLSEVLLLTFGALLGEPYSLAGEGDRLVNDLIPTAADRQRLTGTGSEVRLGMHTENAAHRWLIRDRDLSPNALMLTGITAPAVGAPRTLIANGRIAAARLSAEHRATLRGPCVQLALPLRQRRGSEALRTKASPILTGPEGAEIVTAAFYGDMMMPVDERAREALAAFEATLEDCAAAVTIVPGMLVYIPNAYTMHARDSFPPQFDAKGRAKRWVQRIFLTTRLDTFQMAGELEQRVFELPELVPESAQ
jgi:hypothetical protein